MRREAIAYRLYPAIFFAAARIASAAAGGSEPPTFAAKPTVTKAADGEVKIAFAVSAPTDVEVAVLGADGKVVRHLAAGVLGGEKPPPPPLRPGLAQDLTWDGKGDWGLPAGNGPFRVRVRLGMRAKIGRLIGDSHYNFNGMICRGMLADPRNGDLYLLLTSQDAGTMRYSLRVYDRDGNYLREILPYPAGLDERSRGIFGSLSLPGMARPVPRYYNSYPTIYPFDLSPFDPEQESTAMVWRQFNMAALRPAEGHVILLSDFLRSFFRIRMNDGGAVNEPFAEPLWPSDTKLPGIYDCPVGPVTAALAPDGRTLYVTAFAMATAQKGTTHPDWPEGRIYRVELGKADMRRFADVPLPSERTEIRKVMIPAAGRQALHGITTDRRGASLHAIPPAAESGYMTRTASRSVR